MIIISILLTLSSIIFFLYTIFFDRIEFDVSDYEYDEELKRGASRYHDDEVLKESEENGR